MMVRVGYDRGHSFEKTGGREFSGVVIAVIAVMAVFLLYL
jgi:hypothetical protein